MSAASFTPGSLIKARNREWMVLGLYDSTTLRVRPLNGSEDDQLLIDLSLEQLPVSAATFPFPKIAKLATQESALLLRDSLLLSLRRGAGPFRSFGQISVEPRAYQLVPLLLALKQEKVRLLIADDVGIGKTVEAALIVKEYLARGEIDNFTVLCPPHLVEQWISELDKRFHLKAVPVTAGSASKLEKNLPPGESIFSAYPYTVVSLDYIKSERRRNEFLRACPEFVIVDEAHTCAAASNSKHQRYELLSQLSEDTGRHFVFLTATPHSGDENAFFRLLGLLNKDFEQIQKMSGRDRDKLREKLGSHFVQRRRPDIKDWKEEGIFPERVQSEAVYTLTGEWLSFFNDVLTYCRQAARNTSKQNRTETVLSTLSLLRSASSSPAAAIQALQNKSEGTATSSIDYESIVFDGDVDDLSIDDTQPLLNLPGEIQKLIQVAKRLTGKTDDPKLALLVSEITKLKKDGFNPVVFCRFIPTAHYLKEHLQTHFPESAIEAVTGESSSDDRRETVDLLAESDNRILVATDCLSEGINLQNHFDSVIHYDLSWNPTRHEQREGRIDRYGQPKVVVKTILIYGENNAVDGTVLNVIIKKAESIRRELGVPVPLPDSNHKLKIALLDEMLNSYQPKDDAQISFEDEALNTYVLKPNQLQSYKAIDELWTNAKETAKKSNTIFAQKRIKPEDVIPELQRNLAFIGGKDDVVRFTSRSLARLGAPLEKTGKGFHLPWSRLPSLIKEKLVSDGYSEIKNISFENTTTSFGVSINRNHPLVHALADSLLENTLVDQEDSALLNDPSYLGRAGCWISKHVQSKTIICLLRLRYRLTTQIKGKERRDLVEESVCLGWTGNTIDALIQNDIALKLIAELPDGEPPEQIRKRQLEQTIQGITSQMEKLSDFARERSLTLLQDHRRVREASEGTGRFKIDVLTPPDVISVNVLLPQMDM